MPHFGLMDPEALGPVEAPLQRAKLHIRGGKRRLRQGKISAGIITLYDALVSAMDWYVAVPERRNRLIVKEGENINDEKTQFAILVRSGIVSEPFDYEAFDRLVEQAAHHELSGYYDYADMLRGIEQVMTKLGVMPFDERDLPPEDPNTF